MKYALFLLVMTAYCCAQNLPCCTITAVDVANGSATAKVNQTGQTFRFELLKKQQAGQLRVGRGIYANFVSKQVSLDGKTASGTILVLSSVGRPLASSINIQPGSSTTSRTVTCNAAVAGVKVCSPLAGSTSASPVQFVVATKGFTSSPITTIRIFVNNALAFAGNGSSLNTAVPMSLGSHNILVRAWDSGGAIVEQSLSVTVNSGAQGSSGNATDYGSTNPAPVSLSCGGPSNSPTTYTCSTSSGTPADVGAVTCGSLITITGTTPAAPNSVWLKFQVTTPRANCANIVIDARISSSPVNQVAFDVTADGSTGVPMSYGPGALGLAIGVPAVAGLGSNLSPLPPGGYYIHVYPMASAGTGTWTLKITG